LIVEWLAAAAALWLCYLVAREVGLAAPLAVAGAVALAVCPIFLFTSIQALSDTLATTWSLAAFYCGLRSRQSDRWAVACGAALSVAVLVRMTNVFLTPALVVLLGLNWRRLLRFVVAGLPGAAWLAFYNQHQFGGVLATGYGSVGADFSLSNGMPTLVHFAKWLALLLPGILLVLPVAAVASRATRGRELLACALAFGAIAGFYLFYDISQQVWWCLRYILPVVPFLILAALLGVEALARGPAANWRKFRAVAALVIAGWAVVGSWYWTNALHVLLVQDYEQTYADAARAARERLPSDALVIANNFSGTLYYYTDFPVLRADVVVAEDFARYAAIARKAGRPVCAVLFEFEEQEALRERCPGNWTRLSTFANVGFWRLEPDGGNRY
jgi:4-amino-4-deoxy-L-arabinose transferase-like glycosyltransferase